MIHLYLRNESQILLAVHKNNTNLLTLNYLLKLVQPIQSNRINNFRHNQHQTFSKMTDIPP